MTALKAIVAVAIGILTVLGTALADGAFSTDDWIVLAGAIITTVGVYLAPNKEVE